MRRIAVIILSCLLLTAALAQVSERPRNAGTPFPEEDSGTPPESGYVVLCKIENMVDDGQAVVVERAVQLAANADALIFVIDTPGGLVDAAIEMTRQILQAPCPTYAYVEGMGAISAGAIISYACDHIVLANGTNIGASMPVSMGPEGVAAVDEKSMSFVRAKFRALGEAKNHNPLLGEAMVDDDIVLYGKAEADGTYTTYKVDAGVVTDQFSSRPKVLEPPALGDGVVVPVSLRLAQDAPATRGLPDDAELISPEGKLLTLTTAEASRYQLSTVAATLDDMLEREGLAELQRHYVVPTFAELLFAWLTNPIISGLLLMAGLGGLYAEIRSPGLGFAGIIGAACLGLFFGSYLVLGLADWVDLVLVVIGIGLLLVEIFVIPGFGLAGFAGLASLTVGLYLMVVHAPIPQYEWDFLRLESASQTFATTAVLMALFIVAMWKLLPHTPFARWMVLSHEQLAEAGYVVQDAAEESLNEGLEGVALSMLRPAGRGRFAGRTLDVVTRGEFLEAGTPLRIIRVDGNRHVVAAQQDPTANG